MKSILMAVAGLFAVASAAGAGGGGAEPPRCRLNPEGTPSVLVRYPVPDVSAPPPGDHHNSRHTDFKVQMEFASAGQVLDEERPAIIAVGDFDADGNCDLLWDDGATETQPATRLAVTYGFTQALESHFVEQATPKPSSPWQIVGAFDLTGDGAADVLWWNARDRVGQLWRRSEENVPAWVAAPVSVSLEMPGTWRPYAIARLEGAGSPGVVLATLTGGQASYYRSNWTGTQLHLNYVAPLAGLPSTGWGVAAVGDFNGDLHDDLLIQNMATRRLKVCFMWGLAASECRDTVPNGFDPPLPLVEWHVVGPR